MKIRMGANSIGIRLSKPEVKKLSTKGFLEDKPSFGTTYLSYEVERKAGIKTLSANYHQSKITLMVPETLVKDWQKNTAVGFDSHQAVSDTETLYLLQEKGLSVGTIHWKINRTFSKNPNTIY